MRNIDSICRETIIQGIENIHYRIQKNKNKKIKIISNEDYNIISLNISIIRDEIQKINNVGKYIIKSEKQYERYMERKKKLIENDNRRKIQNDNRLLRRR